MQKNIMLIAVVAMEQQLDAHIAQCMTSVDACQPQLSYLYSVVHGTYRGSIRFDIH